jgi:hypothetical protein
VGPADDRSVYGDGSIALPAASCLLFLKDGPPMGWSGCAGGFRHRRLWQGGGLLDAVAKLASAPPHRSLSASGSWGRGEGGFAFPDARGFPDPA